MFPKERELPEPKLVAADGMKDADVWKPFAPLRYEDTLVDHDTRGVANVVVWLRPDSDDKKTAFPAEKIHPDLRSLEPREHAVLAVRGQFVPRVLAVRAGDRITFDNRLPVPTNVRYNEAPDGEPRGFNVMVGKGTTRTSEPLTALHGVDTFQSDIYPWMKGYARAFDHPYFAVTDAAGKFSIANAPAGTWRLVAWHEAVGYRGGAAGKLGAKVMLSQQVELDPLVLE